MKRYQLKLGLALSVLLSLIVLPVLLSEGQGQDLYTLLRSVLILCIMCFLCWVSIIMAQKNPMLKAWEQVLIALSLNVVISNLFYFAPINLFGDYPINPAQNDPLTHDILRFSIRGTIISLILLPFVYYVEKQKEVQKAKIENERLKRENLQARFNFLQRKMDPHFLFNSLNVLRSGLQDEWARNYIVQLSHVYRYLLQNLNDGGVIPLEKELEFIRSYIHILKERFEDSFRVKISIRPEISTQYNILPMSLQTLIENAVKHNIVSQKKPLKIEIFHENHYIVVRNNIQKKERNTQASAGIGLSNLNERYKLISRMHVLVSEDTRYFTVKVPLLPATG